MSSGLKPRERTAAEAHAGSRTPTDTMPSSSPAQLVLGEPVFECVIDESAGVADDLPPRRTQITELPGSTFEEIFGDAA